MAVSVSYQHSSGGLRPVQMMADRDAHMIMGTITFDSAYLSGGETLDLSAYFPNEVLLVVFDAAWYAGSGTNFDAGYLPKYDYNSTIASAKVVLLGGGADTGGTLDEVVQNTDVSNFVCRFMAIGY